MRSSTYCAESRTRRGAWLLAFLAGCPCLADAAALQEFDAVAAWNGWSRPGRTTEVELRLKSTEHAAVPVELRSDAESVRAIVDLEPGRVYTASVPVGTAELLRLTAGTGATAERRELRLALSEAPLIAWAGPGASEVEGFHVVAIDPSQLPRTASAFSSIDALVIDRSALPALSQEQFEALLSHAAGCGRIVLTGATSDDAGLLRAAVGCGGRAYAAVPSGADVVAAIPPLFQQSPGTLPDTADVSRIDGTGLKVWYRVVTALLVSAALVLAAGIFHPSLVLVVLVPLLASAGALGLVQAQSPDTRLTVWAESGPGDRLARYRGLQQVSMPGRGAVEVPVLATLSRPRACRTGDPVEWSWDTARQRLATARFEGRLFASASLCYSGEFPVARSAAVRPAASERIVLANTGASTSPAGVLTWNARVLPVAPLRPGGTVELAAGAGRAAASGAERLAVDRTPLDSQAILWPLDLSRVPDAPASAAAWWLLRVGPAGQG